MSGKLGMWLMLTLLFLQVSSSSWCSKNQLIKDPNELPIESSFQKNQWFQMWVLRSVIINNQRCPKHIVHIILTYLDFVHTTNVSLFKKNCGGISHNGHWFLCVEKHCLYLYDLATENRVQTFKTPRKSALSLCVIAKSRLFVAGSHKEIYLWNTNSSNLVTTLSGHTKQVICLHIFLNDTRIASASIDQTLRIWTVEKNPGHCLFVLQERVECIVIMPADNTHIVSKSDENKVRVWNSHTGKCIQTHQDNRVSDSNVLSENGRYIASVNTGDKEIKLWNIYTGENLQTVINSVSKYISDVFYLSTDRLVFGDGKIVYVWNLQTGMMIYTRSPFKSYLQVDVQHISGIVERKYLIIIGKEGIFRKKTLMKLYSFETGTEY